MQVPQIRMTGIGLGESPRWRDDRLWFCDWIAREVIALGLDGRSEVITRMGSMPFSIDWLPDGQMLIVSAREGLLLRREPDGSLATHADLKGLSHFPWNDIAVTARGNAYIGNLGFDFPAGQFAPGTIALVTPEGSVSRMADGVAFPNLMVVTPDDSTLIVAESYGSKLTAFDIAADGGISNQRVWAALIDAAPDGICLDAENAIWYADFPHKRCVRVREGGEILETVELDRGCFACALGGADGRTLFMVAADWPALRDPNGQARTGQVLSLEVSTPSAVLVARSS